MNATASVPAVDSAEGPVVVLRRAPRVLIVEDTEDSRRLLWDVLTHAGFDLFEAEDGATAVALAAEHRPDLILMDIRLPVMDGCEATRQIRANPRLAHIPIIAVTAYAGWLEERTARDAGCNAFVAQPVSPRSLLSIVCGLLPAS